MEPQFPLPTPPACLRCGQPCTRHIVLAGSPNGNEGRPYYTCTNGSHARKFSTWDDSQGIVNGNPRCWCGFTSRRVTNNEPTPADFYSCPVGGCRYTEDAPLAPEANSIAVVGGAPRYAEPRPEVNNVEPRPKVNNVEPRPKVNNVEPRPEVNMESRPEVDMEAKPVGMRSAYRKPRHYCCVVM